MIKFRDYIALQERVVPDWVLRTYDSHTKGSDRAFLSLDIDATHSGRITNNRVYPGKKVRAGAPSFTSVDNGGSSQYDKPILTHHDNHQDPVGRVVGTKFIPLKSGEEFKNDFLLPDRDGPGSGFIRLSAAVAKQDAIEKILDNRYQTVSTGQSSNKMTCSICDKQMLPPILRMFGLGGEDDCDHVPGQTYKIKKDGEKGRGTKKICFGITGDLEYHEVSFVNSPADAFARVVEGSFGDSEELKAMWDSAEEYELTSIVDAGKSPVLSKFRIYDAQGNEVKPRT